jgi:hypothetical protein
VRYILTHAVFVPQYSGGPELVGPEGLSPPDESTLSPITKLILVDLWSVDKVVVENAVKQLADFLCDSDDERTDDECTDDQDTFNLIGGTSTIVGVMRRWYFVPGIQAHGCKALAHAFSDDMDSPLQANDCCASEAVVYAMKNYLKNRDVQMNGCRAFGHFCESEECACHYVVNVLNGHGLILAAMKEFPNDAELQERACYALYQMSDWNECRAIIWNSSVCKALWDTIETYKDKDEKHSKAILEYARLAFKNCFDF